MKSFHKRKLSLAFKFYLALAAPLVLISIAVTALTFRGLQHNASELEEVLRFESKANRILSLLLVQDDASKAMLIDPAQLETFSIKKIEAYDEHKNLLGELLKDAKDEKIKSIITQLQAIDEQKLRPIDSLVLERLFENVDQARQMYFQQYEVEKKEYEKLIRQLAEIGTSDLNQAGANLHSKNLESILQIASALLLGILVVLITIFILSRQVEKSEENTRSLLRVLNEGLFFFDSEGRMSAERSENILKILPDSDSINSLHTFFASYAKNSDAAVDVVLEILWNKKNDDFFSEPDATLSLLPREFILEDGRIIHLSYRLVMTAKQKLDRVVVVLTDVTQKLKNEREAVQQAERVRKMSRVAAGFDSYFGFLEEAISLFKNVDGLLSKSQDDLSPMETVQLKRDLHTLKGSTATFEFADLASRIHKLESTIEELGSHDPKSQELWEHIKDQWKFETVDIEQALGLRSNRDKVSIQKSKFDRILSFARTVPHPELLAIVEDSLRYPLAESFAKHEIYLRKLCEKDNKKQVRLTYSNDSSDLSPQEVQRLDGILVHILRNCLDHGIEEVEVRLQAQKARQGLIQIEAYRQKDGGLHLIIRDDGRGINAERLAQKALSSGLWTPERAAKASFQEKIELIFAPHLSTKDEVTEISGRGVGMDAVKSQLDAWGGKISIYSQPGQGTQFEIDVPAPQTLKVARSA